MQTKTPCSWFGVTCEGSQVERLVLPSNGLTGRLSSPIGALGAIVALRLGENRLTDSIPPELGRLRNLRVLGLRDNQLTGPIPSQLGMLQNLNVLALQNNQLTGSIPPDVGNSPLSILNLSGNQLAGQLPLPVAALGGQIQSVNPDRCRLDSNPDLFMPNTQDYIDADLDGDGFICSVALRAPA